MTRAPRGVSLARCMRDRLPRPKRRGADLLPTAMLAIVATLVGCTLMIESSPTAAVPTPTSLVPTDPSPSSISLATFASPLASLDGDVFTGVADVRPDGWSLIDIYFELSGFPDTTWEVYGPDGAAVPPIEGADRLVLYETIPADDPYLRSRVESSRQQGGRPIAVEVLGKPAEVWLNGSTGELVLGWTLPGKSEVLVANTANVTVQQLVDSAEGVHDCCG